MALKWLLNSAHTLLLDHSSRPSSNVEKMSGRNDENDVEMKRVVNGGFQMRLHYPRYVKSDYEKMEEWQVEMLLRQYGLDVKGRFG
ncbi:hypothetical protein Pfo_023092 [Paulownia fortunei]|nr:hypothetical protein Pfo_023092 [Paulownia fortunei]